MLLPEKIGMPSVSGVRNSAVDYALGAGGGLLYALSVGFTGSGLLGGLIGAGIAGSVIKGSRGTAIATILGFQTVMGSLNAPASQTNASPAVM